MFDRERESVYVCWHVLDATVEMSVISIYLFVRWHIKALNRMSPSHSCLVLLSRLLTLVVFIQI